MNNIKNCLTVSRYTFLEILKSKILINVLFLGVGLSFLTFIIHELSFGSSDKITLDVGLGATFFTVLGVSIILGSNLMTKEIESRTIYLTLSKPISRSTFLIGKMVGLGLILFINLLILSLSSLTLYFILGGKFDILIFWNFLFDFLVTLISLNLVLLFSLLANPTLAVIFTLVVVLSGHMLSQLAIMNFVIKNEGLNVFVSFLRWLLPNFDMLNIKDFILYYNTLDTEFLIKGAAYGVLYTIFILLVSVLVFENKNLD